MEQKLLPMILQPYHYLLTAKRYEHPPRIKDGGRKAVLIRDIIHPYTGELLGGYKKGTIGVVIPINESSLQNIFLYNQKWFNGDQTPYVADSHRLDRTYDFFRYHTHHKTGKYELSHWHAHISRFDFEYISEEVKPVKPSKPKNPQVIQLNLFE